MPDQYDHVRPTDGADVPDGVYRVVGADDGRVTLLRVGDANGGRAVTGDVQQVGRETFEISFAPAENPDAEFHPVRGLRSALQGYYHLFSRLLRR